MRKDRLHQYVLCVYILSFFCQRLARGYCQKYCWPIMSTSPTPSHLRWPRRSLGLHVLANYYSSHASRLVIHIQRIFFCIKKTYHAPHCHSIGSPSEHRSSVLATGESEGMLRIAVCSSAIMEMITQIQFKLQLHRPGFEKYVQSMS